MLRMVKFGGITVAAGMVAGLSIVGVMYLRRSEQAPVTVKPGSVGLNNGSVLSNSAGGSSDTATGLNVTSGGNQGSVQGQSLAGGSSSSSPGQSSDSSSPDVTGDQLPTPSQFHVYDKYKNNPSALYIDTKPGTGKTIAKDNAVTIQYRGWLTDGREFDETYARGKAFTFTEGAGSVVNGVAEAVFGMKEGGQRRLIIPPAVGYGAAGKDPVPPDAMMVFDVELVSVK
jgi:FKBP-type peptidyl-prolyl cis-trans isomerase FkpA